MPFMILNVKMWNRFEELVSVTEMWTRSSVLNAVAVS